MDGQEEVRSAAEPLSIGIKGLTREEAMNVGMMGENLTTSVKNRQEANLAAKMSWIGSNGLERRGDGVEQDGIDDGLVMEGDLGDSGRYREHDVEIGDRQ